MATPFSKLPDDLLYASRRAAPRVAVALPAFLHASGERYAVQIIDLSAGGAKLNCPVDLGAQEVVTLDCGVLRRTAAIRWQEGGAIGVAFDQQLTARDVDALISRSEALAARMNLRS